MPLENLFDLRWKEHLRRDADGAPLLPPLFVLAQGRRVRVVDLRPADEATGVVGYIPGSVRLHAGQLDALPQDVAVVVVSRDGVDAAAAALRLERHGMTHVAALDGGVVAWRRIGLGISHDPAGLAWALMAPDETSTIDGPLTADAIRAHIGDPLSVRWVKLVSLVTQGYLSCIDGRDERGIIGTLGGNAGLMLLLLAALERVTGTELDDESVRQALIGRLDDFGDFYMHTDMQALEALTASLRADPRVGAATDGLESPVEWVDFLHDPGPHVRGAILEHLGEPAHVGCGHIRRMLEHPDEYGTRSGLVAATIRAVFELRWAGAPEIGLTVLPGGHDEEAVLNVRLEEDVWGLTRVPLIAPSFGGRQMFVHHPDVADEMRRIGVRSVRGHGAPDLQAMADELAARQWTATLGSLASDLPIFDAVFRRDGPIEVRKGAA